VAVPPPPETRYAQEIKASQVRAYTIYANEIRAQPREVLPVVGLVPKEHLPVIPSADDVVQPLRHVNARFAWHTGRLPKAVGHVDRSKGLPDPFF